MRRLLLLVVALGGLLLLYRLTTADGEDESWEIVRARGTLRVGMDASFPPFELVGADGQVRGLDVDLAEAIARRLELRLEIVNIAFDGLYDALASGEVDLLISALPYEAQRTGDVRYSPPYFVDGLVWIYRTPLREPEADSSLVVLAEAGAEATTLLRHRYPQATVIEVQSEDDVIAGVRQGRGYGVVTRVAACAGGRTGDLIVGAHLTQAPYAVAVSAQTTALADMLMSTVDQVLGSEEWTSIRHRWLGDAC